MVKYLIILTIVSSLASAFWADRRAEIRVTRHYEQIIADLEAQAEKERLTAQANIDKIYRDYQDAKAALIEKPKEIIRYVPKIQQVHSECNVPYGVVGVLNEVRGYPLGTPENPRGTDAEDASASTVTQAVALEQWRDCEVAFESERLKRNALIDAVQAERSSTGTSP
jgi:hypothetical protein